MQLQLEPTIPHNTQGEKIHQDHQDGPGICYSPLTIGEPETQC